VTPLENLHMRMQLEGALESLADERHQREVWLALCVTMLFDDLLLDERSDEDLIGDLLLDAAEATRVTRSSAGLIAFLTNSGPTRATLSSCDTRSGRQS
jgi:hypothetical protein